MKAVMAQQTTTITIPKWARELTTQPQKPVKDLLKTLAFLKMKEYERQTDVFRKKYKIGFTQFEKKIKASKKENFVQWDDYLVWKGMETAYQTWQKRYKER